MRRIGIMLAAVVVTLTSCSWPELDPSGGVAVATMTSVDAWPKSDPRGNASEAAPDTPGNAAEMVAAWTRSDRIEVEGIELGRKYENRILLATNDSGVLNEVRSRLRVEPRERDLQIFCACIGDYALTGYVGDRKAVRVSVHGSRGVYDEIRWHLYDSWGNRRPEHGNMILTPEAKSWLSEWLPSLLPTE